jgi:hypothetical protein
MNQVPGDCYLYSRQIKQIFICIPLLYNNFLCRITLYTGKPFTRFEFHSVMVFVISLVTVYYIPELHAFQQ